MQDGREYESIVGVTAANPNVNSEIRRGIGEIETIRNRPCLCYVANLARELPNRGIESSDYLPFVEMVGTVPSDQKCVDVLLATPGGSVETVGQFVEALRGRFDDVAFIVPAQAMSAGTLWALSGDSVWMTNRAYLGPIDPQVPGRDGRFLPIQALLTLLATIQKSGEERMAKGLQPEWSHIVLLKNMDLKELGAAMTSSKYVVNLASQFIERFKLRHWETHSSSGGLVTAADRHARAEEIAAALCSHDRWKAHGHAINRDVLWRDLKLKVDHPETVPNLDRAIRRLWALWYYLFENSPVTKGLISKNYAFFRNLTVGTPT